MNIAVFCSGNGSNLQAIIDAQKKGYIKGEVRLVVSDVPDCFALKRAETAGIKTFIVTMKQCPSKQEFERLILSKLKQENIELIVLAGYMRLLSPDFINEYRDKIVNIHPALLPSFKGMHAIKDALEYGVKVTGVTVHFVTSGIDEGPIIMQSSVVITRDDTEESLAEAIHREEHKLYPMAIQLFIDGRLKIKGRKVSITD